jgi:acetyl esterase/lipase
MPSTTSNLANYLFATLVTALWANMAFPQDAVAPPSTTTAIPVRVSYDLVYGQSDEPMHRADIYQPKQSADGGLRPGVLLIHGGAWRAGDKINDTQHAKRLAAQGMVVMAINYRLCPKHVFPAQLDDCFLALQWFVEHAKEYSVDTEALGVWGYSAGGHLSALMATQPRDSVPRFKACVAGAAPCDLTQLPADSTMLSGWLGGTRAKFPNRYQEASPVTHVSPDDPPTFLFHGTKDWLVPTTLSDAMEKSLRDNQIEFEYYQVPGKGHLMTFVDTTAVEKSITFLKKHLCVVPPK